MIITIFSNCDTKTIETTYYINGQIAMEVTKINGEIEGVFKMYNPNGTLAREAYIDNGEGQGKTYYEDSVLASEGKYIVYLNSDGFEFLMSYGEHRYYYKNGKLNAVINHDTLSMKGDIKFFYNTGILYIEGQYKNGRMNGIWKIYTINGELAQEEMYENESLVNTKIYIDLAPVGEELFSYHYIPRFNVPFSSEKSIKSIK